MATEGGVAVLSLPNAKITGSVAGSSKSWVVIITGLPEHPPEIGRGSVGAEKEALLERDACLAQGWADARLYRARVEHRSLRRRQQRRRLQSQLQLFQEDVDLSLLIVGGVVDLQQQLNATFTLCQAIIGLLLL